MSVTEQSYFEQRAEAELQLAQQASHPAAIKAHYELARHYLDRLHSAEDGSRNAAAPMMIA